jgi:hypothetical protein
MTRNLGLAALQQYDSRDVVRRVRSGINVVRRGQKRPSTTRFRHPVNLQQTTPKIVRALSLKCHAALGPTATGKGNETPSQFVGQSCNAMTTGVTYATMSSLRSGKDPGGSTDWVMGCRTTSTNMPGLSHVTLDLLSRSAYKTCIIMTPQNVWSGSIEKQLEGRQWGG